MSRSNHVTIRNADPKDCGPVYEMILELADYERLTGEVLVTPELLHQSLFGDSRCANALIGEASGTAVGYAVYFTTFSTFTGKPGIYLEDIYVRTGWRGKGIGKALLKQVARIALQRGCGRLEWAVLDWNQPAIDFYQKLGAQPLSGWTGQRLAGQSLIRAAADED